MRDLDLEYLAQLYVAPPPKVSILNDSGAADGPTRPIIWEHESKRVEKLLARIQSDEDGQGFAPRTSVADDWESVITIFSAEEIAEMRREMVLALNMGDELHSRNTAAALLFLRELVPHLLALASSTGSDRVTNAVKAMSDDQYFFLRLSMAAAKATADAARCVAGASIVTAMAFNCRGFAIRVSGLGDTWFKGPHASVEAKLFEGHSEDEITWMGGESIITETIGLGGFAQAAAPALQSYQGGSYEAMIARNLELYQITVGENPDYLIPALGYRGTPTGIDIFKVLEARVLPTMDIGIAGRNGGQIGAGVVRAPMACFERAAEAYRLQYS